MVKLAGMGPHFTEAEQIGSSARRSKFASVPNTADELRLFGSQGLVAQ